MYKIRNEQKMVNKSKYLFSKFKVKDEKEKKGHKQSAF